MYLKILFVCLVSIQANLNIPIGKNNSRRKKIMTKFFLLGLMFYEHDQQMFTRVNSLARKYILNKFEENIQFNFTEYFQSFDVDQANLDTWPKLCSQLSHGIISLITHLNANDLNWLPTFCSLYQIPYLNLNIDYIKNPFSLSLMPDILPALITLIRHYQISQLVYIYDDINSAYRLKQLMNIQAFHTIQNLNIISPIFRKSR